ncbi:MAG: queuosine precursor transporter [Arcanobacterium sp.]|nr:queuosine precursor transporter [Arcanobacterium sp.]
MARNLRPTALYDVFAVCFVAFLLLSNIGATKLIEIGALTFDGGAILFPLTYIIGDVLSEVYGFQKARRAIFLGFIISVIASLVFWIIIQLPPHPEYTSQAAFEQVLGVVPRFVAASLFAYLIGQLLNSWVLVKVKERWGEGHLWVRLVSSTVVGEFFDSLIFCIIAWVGTASVATIANLTVVGFAYKVGVEILLLPLTYFVIGLVKRREREYLSDVEQ